MEYSSSARGADQNDVTSPAPYLARLFLKQFREIRKVVYNERVPGFCEIKTYPGNTTFRKCEL